MAGLQMSIKKYLWHIVFPNSIENIQNGQRSVYCYRTSSGEKLLGMACRGL